LTPRRATIALSIVTILPFVAGILLLPLGEETKGKSLPS
jgi:hypothetical protein